MAPVKSGLRMFYSKADSNGVCYVSAHGPRRTKWNRTSFFPVVWWKAPGSPNRNPPAAFKARHTGLAGSSCACQFTFASFPDPFPRALRSMSRDSNCQSGEIRTTASLLKLPARFTRTRPSPFSGEMVFTSTKSSPIRPCIRRHSIPDGTGGRNTAFRTHGRAWKLTQSVWNRTSMK